MQLQEEKYLPLGTVVMLKEGKKRVMITGFGVITEKDDKIWDYSGCIYPEGILNFNQILVFDHEQIEKIYYLGLIDEEEESFKETLKELVKKQNNR